MPDTTQELDKKTLALIAYYIYRLDGVIGKTHLQKLLFLTDVLAVKQTKSPITKLEFKRYNHGPYDEKVDSYLKRLKELQYIEEKQHKFHSDPAKKYYRYSIKKVIPYKEQLNKTFDSNQEQLIIIEEVVSSFGQMSLNNLLDLVYKLHTVADEAHNNKLNLFEVAKEYTEDGNEKEPEEDFFSLH